MSSYTISGRIVGTDGAPICAATVVAHEIVDLTSTPTSKGTATTDHDGRYTISWAESSAPPPARDLFVRAERDGECVESPLIGEPRSAVTVDLVLGSGRYIGRSEWERITAKLAPLLGRGAPESVPADRLEWLAKRADVFPTHLGAWVQAHRLAAGRGVKPQSCYAFLRNGLPADLPALLRAGEVAWTGALLSAWARRILPMPDDVEAELARECEAMRELLIEAASHRHVFDAAGLDEKRQPAFRRLWVNRCGSLSDFWDAVRRELGPATAAEFQFVIQAALVVGNDARLLATLASVRSAGEIRTVADLAAWDISRWRSLTSEATAPAMARVLEDSYPTAFLRHALARDRREPHVVAFLVDNPDFDLDRHAIAHHVAGKPDAWRSVPEADRPAARAALERVQRVWRMAPRLGRYDTAKVLLDHGIGSAADVAKFTRSEFVSRFAGLLPTQHHRPFALANAIWDAAAKIRGGAVAIASQFGMAGSGGDFLPLAGIGDFGLAQAGGGLDSLAAILGTLDACACTHCQSVLGPAAYLADLLGFLDDRPAKTKVDALSVLRVRRPDIEHILLDCANTHTVLPYIDLVNELLERTLAGKLDGHSYQTTATADELRSHPEHLDAQLYANSPLTSLAHPWVLPFSLPELEAHLYLPQLGISRAELMQMLGADKLALAAEMLSVSRAEAQLISTASNDARACWGFGDNEGNWAGTLATDIPDLLRRGGYTLDELRELLTLTFVDPNHYVEQAGIEIRWSKTCTLADATIVNLDAHALDRLHRFSRVARRTNIPVRMLNVLIDDVGDGKLDQKFLISLGHALVLHERFGRPWDEIATWWSDRMDAREYADGLPALYQRRFLADNTAPGAFAPTGPRGDGIIGAAQIGSNELPIVLAAISCTTADYERILSASLASDALTLANLTRLYAITSLSRALGLSIAELIILHEQSGVDPFHSPANTLRFVELLDQVRGSNLSLVELDWLLRHEGPPLFDDVTLARTLDELARGLGKFDAEVLPEKVAAQRRRSLLIDTAATSFGLLPAVAEALLFNVLTIPDGEGPLGHVYAQTFDINGATAQLGWLRLAKAAVFTSRHRLSADELRWYVGRLDGAWLALDSLPLRTSDAEASFTAWYRLHAALDLRSLFRPGPLGHATLAEAPTLQSALEILVDHTEWPIDGLAFLADKFGWSTAAELADERNLLRLKQIADAAAQAGVKFDVLWWWVHKTPTLARSAEIKAAARAKHDEQQWRSIAIALRDEIRAAQRDALVAAVLATNNSFSTTNDLYEHLLIDVEMSPCMLTSRIRAAAGSVQTFIQRVLLRLEADDVTFASDAAKQWEWMKNYRVWEANRKVFLYPENWLEPELRPDKTSLFDALEQKLLQDTLEPDSIERALAGYLDGLELIANLELAAIYSNFGELWLLGRTQNNPRQWFLRSRTKAKQWTAWEPLPAQIDSDHVAVVARDGRVQLFWLTLIETNTSKFIPAPDGDHNAHYVAISWMQRSDEGWSRSEVSERSDPVFKQWNAGSRPYLLRTFVADDEIRLLVFRRSHGGSVIPVAEFSYDVRARHVAYIGMDFDADVFADLLTPHGALQKSSWVGLQPSYRFDGQRFCKLRHNVDPGGDDGILDILADLPPTAAATSFAQGSSSGVLFWRATRSGYRSLLHASDYWGPDPTKAWLPVVYDDRQHKFLLEPLPVAGDASPEGDEVSPMLLGAFDVAPYFGCMEFVPPKWLAAGPPLGKIQKQKDGLHELDVWPEGIPGDLGVQVPAVLGKFLLGQAKALVGGNNGLQSYDAGPEPGAMSVAMQTLYHPHASRLAERMLELGVEGLYRPPTSHPLFRQRLTLHPLAPDGLDLNEQILRGPAPKEHFDFDWGTPFALYNWEVFFHLPMLIAAKLGADQQFAEAQRWYHMMFDPIEVVDLPGETNASKFWRTKPFVEQANALSKNMLLALLGVGVSPAEQQVAIDAFEQQITAWRQHPFDPHAIARIRPGVYQRNLLMRYLDNLIAWADHLFRRDSMESLDEATLLYVLVSQLLGPRPQQVPAAEASPKSYHQLATEPHDDAVVQLENWVLTPQQGAKTLGCDGDVEAPVDPPPVSWRFGYFCHPPNPELWKYWDIIDDRLWKLRHCRNIDGVERRLPLFDPPIDSALLVRATAAGVDLSEVLGELDAGLPPYRFRFVHARATNMCASLRNLGASLLAAIEKRDAEALSRVRAEQEISLLAAIRDVRQRQIDETRSVLESLRLARDTVEHRRAYFAKLVDDGLSMGEFLAQTMSLQAGILRAVTQGALATAGLFHMIPDITISVGTDMSTKTSYGGSFLGSGLRAGAEYLGVVPTALDAAGAWIASNAFYDRRAQEWEFQRDQAESELTRIDRDIAAAEIRLAIVERELANHELQIEQSSEVDRFLREKLSNRELYDWMLGQLSALYFQTYQLAFDLAKRAERAYRHELAIPDNAPPIIAYGHWDNLHKGLLVGERLGLDLDRLDVAYMDRDIREFELRKQVSLAQLAPDCLRALQEKGTCELELPEALFDLDHAGHYLRRLRGVRVTIPATVGAFTHVGARLELLDHRTRLNPSLAGGYAEKQDDARFRYGHGGGQVIATSTAVTDGGVFDLDLRDERYLPFEYAGAISRWKLTLPDGLRQFDYRSISDVVLHLDMTSRDGGTPLHDAAQGHLVAQLTGLVGGLSLGQLFVVQNAFPHEWERFFLPDPDATEQTLVLPLGPRAFPYFAQRRGFVITSIDVALVLPASLNASEQHVKLRCGEHESAVLLTRPQNETLLAGSTGVLAPKQPPGTWTFVRSKAQQPGALDNGEGWLDPDKIAGMLVVARYTLVS